MSHRPLILLLEDEPLILMDLEMAAEDRGCACLATTCVEQAFAALGGDGLPDVAVLDVTLQAGNTCVPIATELRRLGVPYLLHSGDLDRQDERIRQLQAELVPKPASSARVIEKALELLDPDGLPEKPALPDSCQLACGVKSIHAGTQSGEIASIRK